MIYGSLDMLWQAALFGLCTHHTRTPGHTHSSDTHVHMPMLDTHKHSSDTHVHIHMPGHTHAPAHTHSDTHIHVHMPGYTHTFIHSHIHTHAWTYMHTLIQTHTFTCIYMGTHIHNHAWGHTYMHTHVPGCTCTHKLTHKDSAYRMHVHTHTYSLSPGHSQCCCYIPLRSALQKRPENSAQCSLCLGPSSLPLSLAESHASLCMSLKVTSFRHLPWVPRSPGASGRCSAVPLSSLQ